MIERHHPAQNLAATLVRAGRSSVLLLLLVAGLAGCRHKTPQLPYVSMASPLELEVVPVPNDLPMIAEEPAPAPIPLPSEPVEPSKPVVRRRPVSPKEAPPVQVASAAEPAALAIGALTSGDDSTPQNQQQAKDMIAAITKRLNALPSKIASPKKDEVRKVRHFLQEAQHALDSGDVEGAKNLATKASLLMDDVEKK